MKKSVPTTGTIPLDPDTRYDAAVEALSRDAAAKGRIMQKISTGVEEILGKLNALGEEHRAAERAERRVQREAVMAGVDVLLDRARALPAEKAKLRAEHGPLIGKLGALDWEAIRQRATVRIVPGSEHTVLTRLGLLQRQVDEVQPVLAERSENDLREAIAQVEACDGSDENVARYHMAALERAAGYGVGHCTYITERMVAIRRLLDEISADLDATDAALLKDAAPGQEAE